MSEYDEAKIEALLKAVEPFAIAAGRGQVSRHVVAEAKGTLRDLSLTSLDFPEIGFGIYTAQSQMSWNNWRELLDAYAAIKNFEPVPAIRE